MLAYEEYSLDDKLCALSVLNGGPSGEMPLDQLERVLDLIEYVKEHRGQSIG